MTGIKNKGVYNVDYFYKYGLYIIFAAIVIGLSIVTPKFYASENIINIFMQSAPVGISVIGMVFVLVIEGIDLSIGTTMCFSAIVSTMMINDGYGVIPVLLAAVACGALVGSINGVIMSRWNVTPFIVTLATATFGRGVTLLINKTQTLYVSGGVGDLLVLTRVLGIPLIVIGFIILAVIGQFVLTKTAFGKQLFAIGNNELAAEKIGIKVNGKRFFVYLICGLFAGISGLVSATQIGAVPPELGVGREFAAISAAVLGGVSLFGGRGNIIPGAIVGTLLITVIENALVLLNANPYAFTVVRGLVIFIAVMIDCIRNKNELR